MEEFDVTEHTDVADDGATGRILAATFLMLAEGGYGHLSVQAVGLRAGVTRPTIYRRWATKEELAIASIAWAQEGVGEIVPTGDLEADLVALLERMRWTMTAANGLAVVASFLAEAHTTPGLLDAFHRYVIAPRRTAIAAVFERAHPEWDAAMVTIVSDLVSGAFYARAIAGIPFTPDWAQQITRCVLDGHMTVPHAE
jgi:AcrR family transcriptional regulator